MISFLYLLAIDIVLLLNKILLYIPYFRSRTVSRTALRELPYPGQRRRSPSRSPWINSNPPAHKYLVDWVRGPIPQLTVTKLLK